MKSFKEVAECLSHQLQFLQDSGILMNMPFEHSDSQSLELKKQKNMQELTKKRNENLKLENSQQKSLIEELRMVQ